MKKLLIAVTLSVLASTTTAAEPAKPPFTFDLNEWTAAAKNALLYGCVRASLAVARCECYVRGVRARYTERETVVFNRTFEEGRPNAALEKWSEHVVQTCNTYYK